MFTNRVLFGIGAGVLLIVAIVVALLSINTAALARQGAEAPSVSADVARWVAFGEYYTRLNAGASTTFNAQNSGDILSARYTGQALSEFERTGQKILLPTCIPSGLQAELPSSIGSNSWKTLVPACSQ